MRTRWLSALVVVFAATILGAAGAAGCSSSSDEADPGSSPETGQDEQRSAEGGDDLGDGGAKDARPGDAEGGAPAGDILGTLASGACGLVKTEIAANTPSLENNLLVFVAGETFDKASLSPGGQVLFDTPNAGGSSGESEVMSFEVLHYCEGASLVKTETQILYEDAGTGPKSITDILVEIGGKKVGVSVTRAYKPPTQPPMTDADVKALLEKKLDGINVSSERVLPGDKWVKQILHVFSVSQALTDAIGRVWPTIDAAKRADTIVLVTQTTGGGFVYCSNQHPPLGAECQ